MQSDDGLASVPRDARRKDLRSPPGSSSRTMKRGIFSKQTPMKRTMLLPVIDQNHETPQTEAVSARDTSRDSS